MPAVREADPPRGNESSTLQVKVGGMSCSFCAESIRKAIGRKSGVHEVHVSLAHEEALVRYHPDRLTEDRIHDTLRGLGYIVRDPRKVQSFEEQEALMRRERNDLFTAAFFAVSLFLMMSGMWLDLWRTQTWHIDTALSLRRTSSSDGPPCPPHGMGAARRGITNQHVLLTAGAIAGYIGGLLGSPNAVGVPLARPAWCIRYGR